MKYIAEYKHGGKGQALHGVVPVCCILRLTRLEQQGKLFRGWVTVTTIAIGDTVKVFMMEGCTYQEDCVGRSGYIK